MEKEEKNFNMPLTYQVVKSNSKVTNGLEGYVTCRAHYTSYQV